MLGLRRFSASGFWPLVRDTSTAVLILHEPPVEILKRTTSAADAAGHRVSRVFFADPDFLETFDVPLGFSAYGSTEAGGLCHIWAWRRDDGLAQPFDDAGWFATGDLGRVDDAGNLVFVERASESIRVKGEFVPIGHVEQRFSSVDGIDDVAVWRRSSDLVDDEIVLYVTGSAIPTEGIRAVSEGLPAFMRPAAAARVAEIPRDPGAGKVRRRLLADATVLEWTNLASP